MDVTARDRYVTTFAHELGHNLGLRHAPCGVPGRLLNPEGYRDLMSYCGPEGVSDFNFTLALDYRDAIAASALARRPAAAPKTLLLWGSIRDGAD